MVNKVIVRVKNENPVKGHWYVFKTKWGIVQCDAISIAFETPLEVN